MVRDNTVRVMRCVRRRGTYRVVSHAARAASRVTVRVLTDTLAHATPRPVAPGTCAVVALPEDKTFLRIVMLPHAAARHMRTAVAHEIEGQIPLRADDVYYDAQRVPALDRDGKAAVLLVAVARTVVDATFALVRDAGLRVVAMEPDSIADVRALAPPSPCILLFCSQSHTRITAVVGGVPVFTVSVPVGYVAFAASVAQAFGISQDDARMRLAADGIGSYIDADPLFRALTPQLRMIVSEIQKSVAFVTHIVPVAITDVVFYGAAAQLRGLRAYIVRETGLRIRHADPWAQCALAEHTVPPLPYTQAMDAVTAIGCMLRELHYEDYN